MKHYIYYFLTIFFSYLIGSIPFGWLYVKIFLKKEIRKIGSGNIGATNVYRAAGFLPAVFVFLLDFFKGFFVACFVSKYFSYSYLTVVSGVFVIIGHTNSVFLKFKGGKGVATTAGVISFFFPKLLVLSLFVFMVIFFLSKTVSLSSLISAFFFTSCVFLTQKVLIYRIFILFVFLLILLKHRSNIKRIIKKKENKIRL